jgi:DNA-directed RNA polymerase specialized sigma24 family protein
MMDPHIELADIVLRNLADWQAEFELVQPRVGGSWVTLTSTGSAGGSPVETYVIRKADLEAVLAAVRRRIRRLPPALRAVYREVYVGDAPPKRSVSAARIGCHERTLSRDIGRIRQLVAGTLANLGPDRLRGLLK